MVDRLLGNDRIGGGNAGRERSHLLDLRVGDATTRRAWEGLGPGGRPSTVRRRALALGVSLGPRAGRAGPLKLPYSSCMLASVDRPGRMVRMSAAGLMPEALTPNAWRSWGVAT